MKIKAIVNPIFSNRDASGNVYWGFRYVETETGKKVEAQFSGDSSNIAHAVELMGFKWNEVYWIVTGMPKKEFVKTIRTWPYAGCPSEKIAEYIKAELKNKDTPIYGS